MAADDAKGKCLDRSAHRIVIRRGATQRDIPFLVHVIKAHTDYPLVALDYNDSQCYPKRIAVKLLLRKNSECFLSNLKEVEQVFHNIDIRGWEITLYTSETEEAMVVYQALYGEQGVWVRPASMWNETVKRDGKTYRRFYRLDRIERVEKYERLFDEGIEQGSR